MCVNDVKQTFIKKLLILKIMKQKLSIGLKEVLEYYLNYLRHVNDNVGRPV